MLMRILWSNGDFYRLNIPVSPLIAKRTHGAPCLPAGRKRSASSLQERRKETLATARVWTKQSEHENFSVTGSCTAISDSRNFAEPLPEIEILEIIEPPKLFDFTAAWQWLSEQAAILRKVFQSPLSLRAIFLCHPERAARRRLKYLTNLNLQKAAFLTHSSPFNTLIKGLAISFSIFFLSFFSMNYEAYWDIAKHSWEESIQPGVLQASSVFLPQKSTEELIKNSEISEKIQKNTSKKEQSRFSILAPETHTVENLEKSLQPAAITPPDHRLIIPKIGKNVPIVESKADNLYSKNWEGLEKELLSDLKRGVVHYPGTAFPGQKGNVFLTGHSSYYPWDDGEYKDVFALLGKLEVGDEIVLFYNQKEYRYKVSDIRQVKPDNVEILQQTDDNRLTLMTCTPVGTTLRRLVITALQV